MIPLTSNAQSIRTQCPTPLNLSPPRPNGTVACSALAEFGRTDATSAIMIALNKLPKKWRLEIQQETDEANGEVDFLLQEELEEFNEECDEHAEYTLSHELIYDFEPFAEISEGALPPDTTCNSHQIPSCLLQTTPKW